MRASAHFSSRAFLARALSALAILSTLVIGAGVQVTPARASVGIVVDTADGGAPSEDGHCSLSEAITNANNDLQTFTECASGVGADTISFDAGLGTTTIALTANLPPSSDADLTTIDGGGNITIDAGGTAGRGVFSVATGGALELLSITVTGGNLFDGSGAYVASSASLSITGSTFTGNQTNTSTCSGCGGAGVMNDGGTLIIDASTFSNNTSVGYGGAVLNKNGSTVIKNSTFSGNTAVGGGAVNTQGASGSTSIINSTFTANSSNAGRGAVEQVDGTLNLYNSIIANSAAGDDCLTQSGTFNADHDLIKDSSPACGLTDGTSGNIIGSDPSLGSATGSPAYFPLNAVSPAIDAGDNSHMLSSTDEALQGRFADDPMIYDTGAGTAPIVDLGAVERHFDCSPYTHAYVDINAGGAQDGTSWADALHDLQLGINLAHVCSLVDVVVAKGVYLPDGANSGDRTLSFNIYPGVAVYGGYPTGGGTRDPNSNVTVLSGNLAGDDTVDGNGVVQNTGNIHNNNNSYHVVKLDGTTGSTVGLTTVLDGFTITAGQANGSNWLGSGGGLFCDGHGSGNECSPTLTNLIFAGNIANNGGGAVFLEADSGGVSDPHLAYVNFQHNGASNGGAMLNYGFGGEASPSLTGVYFDTNAASGSGGAMYDDGFGGNSNPALTQATFSGNTAGNTGGAIQNDASGNGHASPTFVDSTFSANVSSGSGGAMYNNGSGGHSDPEFRQVLFTNNGAGLNGGALFNNGYNGHSSPIFANVTFYQNSAVDGGALFNYGDGGISSPAVWNVTFKLNNATHSGGALYNYAANSGASIPSVVNAILWGDTATTAGPEMFNDGGAPSVSTSVVQGGCASLTGANCGSGNLSADPMLGSLAGNGGYTLTMALQAGSSAIDTGDDDVCGDSQTVNSVDQRHVTRPSGLHCDIGAFEDTVGREDVLIGGNLEGAYNLAPSGSTRQSYAGVNSGPVNVLHTGGDPLIASLRVLLKKSPTYSSYTEFMGLPGSQLSDSYIFPWYNNATSSGLDSQLRFGNVGNLSTTVTVTIGGAVQGSYPLSPNQSLRVSYANLNSGPVVVSSSGEPIIAAMRVNLKKVPGFTSYTEFLGVSSNSTVATGYMFPWYNNASNSGLDSQLRFGNVGGSPTTVTVLVGGVSQGTYNLNPNQSTRISYTNLNNGSVEVDSSAGVPIIASMRVNLKPSATYSSYSEFMGLSTAPEDKYVFPWYNNATSSGLDSQLRFGNVGTSSTTVTVTIGGAVQGTYPLSPNESTRVSYSNLNDGPVVVSSSGGVPIVAAMRVNLKTSATYSSYAEFLGLSSGSPVGLPGDELGPSYLFPWYNDASNSGLDSQLRFGRP